tara:strand:- start:203 stop:415 length:213 start_codon:yes stop_codon:yes gene_type:complete
MPNILSQDWGALLQQLLSAQGLELAIFLLFIAAALGLLLAVIRFIFQNGVMMLIGGVVLFIFLMQSGFKL